MQSIFLSFVVCASVTDNCLSKKYTVAAEASIILACCWLSTNLILGKSEKFKVLFIFIWLRRAMLYSAICHEMRPLLGSLATSKSPRDKFLNSYWFAPFFAAKK